jgi:hypothetical protein
MRGDAIERDAMLSQHPAAQGIPHAHPLRALRRMVDEALVRQAVPADWTAFDPGREAASSSAAAGA